MCNMYSCLFFGLTEEDSREKVALIIACTQYSNLDNLDVIERSVKNLHYALDLADWQGKVRRNARSLVIKLI